MTFKSENAFKDWVLRTRFKDCEAFKIEARAVQGFPDCVVSPKDKTLPNMFIEFKYEPSRNFKRGLAVKYRPLQVHILQQLNRNNTAVACIGFKDKWILCEATKDNKATNIIEEHGYASINN